MNLKIVKAVTTISLIYTLTVAIASLIGISITGFYPGIIVLLLLTLIPISSRIYSKKLFGKTDGTQRKYYIALTIINLLTILIVLWMSFVILVDRVFVKIL
ncbi:MAG: hypothetical protein Q8K64_09685 [Sediminibacterium sp.]|nr:hypothetical protein [Sediminibacterium sp.]